MPSPALTWLPVTAQKALTVGVLPKFEAHFRVVPNQLGTRATPEPGGGHRYPPDPLGTDLIAMWSCFNEVYQIIVEDSGLEMSQLCARDPLLEREFHRMVALPTEVPQGEYWESVGGKLRKVDDPVPGSIDRIAKTLRDAYAHRHWHFGNLSARAYWGEMGWQVDGSPSEFKLDERGEANFRGYIADAKTPFHVKPFWQLKDLRIIVVGYATLRFSLHMFLNVLLKGDTTHVFNA